ncbi:hypothetical protein OJAV_G00210460 [Oryzias javanicus]|uniref:Nanos-type domain-containing protein n=1 Tax=Oryzias javanicus TaxID=123683 RepID=A0A437C268_ORYJA|nr:hypothetical protein OJAV_G00210460 [Oryzias javanicus]
MDLWARVQAPCDYTFDFWNDYLGLSSLVSRNRLRIPACGPNSITESIKASLGLQDGPPDCCCAAPAISHLPEDLHAGSRDSVLYGGSAGGRQDLLSAEGRREHAHRDKPEPRVCVFCRNNGAPEEVYGTHILKTGEGRVLCPILRAYTCPLCSANGDNAHTIKYCPLSRDQRPRGGRVKRLKIF